MLSRDQFEPLAKRLPSPVEVPSLEEAVHVPLQQVRPGLKRRRLNLLGEQLALGDELEGRFELLLLGKQRAEVEGGGCLAVLATVP